MPYQQGAPMVSPLGHLPTPAEALDAPDWPSTGGYDTRPGAPPPVPRSFDQPPPPRREPKPEPREPVMADAPKAEPPRAEETKQERPSSIASFFGFGAKPEESEPEPSEPKVQRKGWWQRKPDA